MTVSVTLIYAILLSLLYIVLSARVGSTRVRRKITIGDGGNADLLRRIRVHGNFSEYTPICLIMIHLLEVSAFSPTVIHFLGITLFVGRLVHAWGFGSTPENMAGRSVGMILTFAVIVVAGRLTIARLGFGLML